MSLLRRIKCALGMHPGFRDLQVLPGVVYARCRECKRVEICRSDTPPGPWDQDA